MFQRTIFQSFKLAFEGLKFIFQTERNMKIHLIFALIAVTSSFIFRISEIEFIFIIFSIALVLIAEAANTAFEYLLDFIHGDAFHPDVKLLKDVAAGGVFIAALAAVAVGSIIFIPKLFILFKLIFMSKV